MRNSKPEFVFEDGFLVIKPEGGYLRIRIWPVPYACQCRKDGPEEEFRPEFRVISPDINAAGSSDSEYREDSSRNLKKRHDMSEGENQKREAEQVGPHGQRSHRLDSREVPAGQ